MPLDTAQLAADLRGIIGDMPQSLTFGSRSYLCGRVSMRASELIQLRVSLGTEYRLTVVVVRSDFVPAVPAQGDVVTYGDPAVSYRVLDTEECTDQVDLRLHLGVRYQGGT
jgi:hypothetical protein